MISYTEKMKKDVTRRTRSQVSKVLGTTMDLRGTAWLDQAQWRPGQRCEASLHPVDRSKENLISDLRRHHKVRFHHADEDG